MKVTFAKLERAATARGDETLLDLARRAGVPIGNSCGAVGVCARCRVRVVEGGDALSPRTTHERGLAARGKLDDDERLACQAVVRGDCRVVADYW